MTEDMRRFLRSVRVALDDLAQSGDRAEYNQLQAFIGEHGLDGLDLDEIVEKSLI